MVIRGSLGSPKAAGSPQAGKNARGTNRACLSGAEKSRRIIPSFHEELSSPLEKTRTVLGSGNKKVRTGSPPDDGKVCRRGNEGKGHTGLFRDVRGAWRRGTVGFRWGRRLSLESRKGNFLNTKFLLFLLKVPWPHREGGKPWTEMSTGTGSSTAEQGKNSEIPGWVYQLRPWR